MTDKSQVQNVYKIESHDEKLRSNTLDPGLKQIV